MLQQLCRQRLVGFYTLYLAGLLLGTAQVIAQNLLHQGSEMPWGRVSSFLHAQLADTKAGKSEHIPYKEARNIAYTTLYSAPIVPPAPEEVAQICRPGDKA